jgi:hypothetical protein
MLVRELLRIAVADLRPSGPELDSLVEEATGRLAAELGRPGPGTSREPCRMGRQQRALEALLPEAAGQGATAMPPDAVLEAAARMLAAGREGLAVRRRSEFDEHWVAEGPDGSLLRLPRGAVARAVDRCAAEAAKQAGMDRGAVRAEFRRAFAIQATSALATAYPQGPALHVRAAPRHGLVLLYGNRTREQARDLYCRGIPSPGLLAQTALPRVPVSSVLRQAASWEAVRRLRMASRTPSGTERPPPGRSRGVLLSMTLPPDCLI